MTKEHGFKFVAADLTTRKHAFSYLEALRTGEWLVASAPTNHSSPCPNHEGDGLCVAATVQAACSGGQSASTAVGLVVAYNSADILASGEGKTRVRRLKVESIFDPAHLIRLGLCADLYGADLYGADLRSADLRSADLRSANLYGANLYGADLYGANLYGADLRSADLRSANLRSANLYGANLYGAINIPASAVGGRRS